MDLLDWIYYDGLRYLVLFAPERYKVIYDRTNYLVVKKVVLHIVLIIILQESELIHIILYLEKKALTFHNVIIFINSIVNKNENNYYHNIFLEKG